MTKIDVAYKMTDTERQICHMITEKIEWELNDWAVADFQVDEYFTTVPLTEKNVYNTPSYNIHTGARNIDTVIWPEFIPEVRDMLDNYDSVLVSFSLDDYEGKLHNSSGSATAKFGCVHFNETYRQWLLYKGALEDLLDPLHCYWDNVLNSYFHELAHTVELTIEENLGKDICQFHIVASTFIKQAGLDPLIAERYYFTHNAVVDGEKVGIPYDFWTGELI